VKLEYENTTLSITEGKIDLQITTEHGVKGIQIDQETGTVIGGSNAPKSSDTPT
jgi:hypothetical protein